jgi:hypothetical protein
MKFYITGTRRGLGKALEEKYGNCGSLEDCDVFINCKHDGFSQVDLLYKAIEKKKKVINIGSSASDWIYHPGKKTYKYGVEKKALRDANSQLFDNYYDTTCINFGFFDTERVAHVDTPKMDLEYVVSVVDWVLNQPYRVKELTVCPKGKGQ